MHITLEHTKILKCPLLKEFESSGEERTDAYEMKAQTKYQESVCASHRRHKRDRRNHWHGAGILLLREPTLLSRISMCHL